MNVYGSCDIPNISNAVETRLEVDDRARNSSSDQEFNLGMDAFLC